MPLSFLTRRYCAVITAILILTFLLPASTNAQTEIIYSSFPAPCTITTDLYVVELQVTTSPALFTDYPSSILLEFEGRSPVVVPMSFDSRSSVKRYVLNDADGEYRQYELRGASAVLHVPEGAVVRFQVVEYPCTPTTPTGTVSGVVRQHGSLKPVEGMTVCLQPMNFCGVTDASGEFQLVGVVPPGEYELVSTGPKFRDLSTTVVVDESQEYYEIIQRRGGGQ